MQTDYTNIIGNESREEFQTLLSRLRITPKDTNRTLTTKNFKLVRKYEDNLFANGLNVVMFPPNEIRVYNSEINKV